MAKILNLFQTSKYFSKKVNIPVLGYDKAYACAFEFPFQRIY